MSWSSRNSFRSIEIVVGPAWWPTVGFVLLALLAQTSLAPWLAVRGAVPSLVTIAVVLYAAKVGARRGALLGVIAGVLEDGFAGTAGAWTIATTGVALAVGAISRTFFADGTPMLGALVVLAVLARDGLFWLAMRVDGYPRGFALAHLHTTVVQAVLTGLCAVAYLVVRARVVVDPTRIERRP